MSTPEPGRAMSKTERAARLLEATGLGALLRRLPAWRGALVLNYHRIGDGSRSPFDRGLWSATPEELDLQLGVLGRHFEVAGPPDLLAASEQRFGRVVLLTFDDGYRDNYVQAYPALRAHGLRATFFVATGFIDRPRAAWWDEIAWMVRTSPRPSVPAGSWLDGPVAFDEPERERAVARLVAHYKGLDEGRSAEFLDFLAEASGSGRIAESESRETWMTWDMLREMHAGGMWIGGHTVDHPILALSSRSRQEREIAGCGERLELELGERPRYFSYPVGLRSSFDHVTKAILAENGFRVAFSFYGGYRKGSTGDVYDVPRCFMGLGTSPARYRAMVTIPQIFARW